MVADKRFALLIQGYEPSVITPSLIRINGASDRTLTYNFQFRRLALCTIELRMHWYGIWESNPSLDFERVLSFSIDESRKWYIHLAEMVSNATGKYF